MTESPKGVEAPMSAGILVETMTCLREKLSLHSFTSSLGGLHFLCLSGISFFLVFLPLPRVESDTSYVGTSAKLSVISDGMARLTPARFYAPSWITCA